MSLDDEFSSCAVCGRTMLRGERAAEYVDADGGPALVCTLCKGRAEAAGWVPTAYAQEIEQPDAGRRRPGLALKVRERLARRVEERAPAPEEPQPPPSPIEVFNASREARKVAGLVRSLGEPRVSVREDGHAEAVIVVAWDLSWYRWRVSPNEVRELAKGNEISELPHEDRVWNATAAEDGTLSLA
ncbi:MAG TPA: hypothetical protein VK326_07705 [Solirubrobacterales bacterium]|nr:hypothetical protein [Solirubrobacterales bacterium]